MCRVESKEEIEWFTRRLLTWAKHNLRDYPWRITEDPYSILVAEFLLQRTDADTVLPIYKVFLTQYPTLNELAIASLAEGIALVEDIGKILQPPRLFKINTRDLF